MRFYAHDGKSTHGPAGIEELLKLPGFDGDTLVCPVGSDDPADWKAALAYPSFKKALLEAPAAAPAPIEPLKALPPMPTFAAPKADQPPVPAPFPLPLPAALPPLAEAPTFAAPVPIAPPPIAAAPPSPISVKTSACPRCDHANLEGARYCNSCGGRMDGRLEDLSTAPSASGFAAPASAPPSIPAAAPASDPFAHHDPLVFYPEPFQAPPPETRRPPQPGRMGQLAEYEESAPAAPSPAPSPAPDPEPTAWSTPLWKRPVAVGAFAFALTVGAGYAYMKTSLRAPVELASETPASEPPPMPDAPPPAPVETPKPPLYSTPPALSALPARPPKQASKAPAKKARRPRAKPALPPELTSGGDTFIESRAPEPKPKARPRGKRAAKAAAAQAPAADGTDPLLEALLTDATQSPADAGAAAAPEEAAENAPPMIGQRPAGAPPKFALPGLQRPVSASDRAQRGPRASEDEIPLEPSDDGEVPLAEPGRSSPTPGIEDEPVKSAEGDQLALVQVHEQFDFCAQLIAQAAYGDHYDTCLCKDTRESAPYRGRRGFYVTAKKKEANAGRLETSAKIVSSKIEGGVASITARWKSAVETKGRTAAQSWKLEDGLWCQAP